MVPVNNIASGYSIRHLFFFIFIPFIMWYVVLPFQTKCNQWFHDAKEYIGSNIPLYFVPEYITKNTEEAIKHLTTAISLNPSDRSCTVYRKYYPKWGFYHFRAIAKQHQNDLTGAMEDFNQAIALNPRFAIAYYQRGILLFLMGNEHDANMDIKKAKKLDSDIKIEDLYIPK